MTTTDWQGCYDEGWQGSGCLLPESFAHPAKFSFGLITRIVRHGIDQGYWKAGDTIGDPFGGVACGGIVCGYHGLNWVGCEIEPRFVELGNKNIAVHGPRWCAGELVSCVQLLQGDSRKFAEVVGGHLTGAVTSPPYAEGLGHGGEKKNEVGRGDVAYAERMYGRYGSADGQIEQLSTGSINAAITSPPYAEAIGNPNGIDYSKAKGKHDGLKPSIARDSIGGPYGTEAGQIGSLPSGDVDGIVTSPPYASTDTKPTKLGTGKGTRADGDSAGRNKGDYHYPESDGQIGVLSSGEVDAVTTSPPFESSLASGVLSEEMKAEMASRGHKPSASGESASYGDDEANIGNDSGETYWQAMAIVYQQMWLAMKPGAVAAIVVKDYVKNKARVPLCDDTCRLLEHVGFHVFERSRCWLVKERREPSLFGGEHVTTKERKSFFRRLAEKKGSPRIDFEEVIWCRKDCA